MNNINMKGIARYEADKLQDKNLQDTLERRDLSNMVIDENMDTELAEGYYKFLNGMSDTLPSTEMIEKAKNMAQEGSGIISIGYGISVSRDLNILSTIPKTDRTERADIITADGYDASETFYVNYTITSRRVDLTQEENLRYPMERIEAIQESIREYQNELKNKKTL